MDTMSSVTYLGYMDTADGISHIGCVDRQLVVEHGHVFSSKRALAQRKLSHVEEAYYRAGDSLSGSLSESEGDSTSSVFCLFVNCFFLREPLSWLVREPLFMARKELSLEGV